MKPANPSAIASLPFLADLLEPGEGAVQRSTRLANQLMAEFAIAPAVRIPGLTRLPAPDTLTNIRQWLTQADPRLLQRDPTPAQWGRVVAAFAQALRAL